MILESNKQQNLKKNPKVHKLHKTFEEISAKRMIAQLSSFRQFTYYIINYFNIFRYFQVSILGRKTKVNSTESTKEAK